FVKVLKDLAIAEKKLVLLLLDPQTAGCQQIERAARNIHNVRVLHVNNLNVKDLLEAEVVLTSQRQVELLNQRFTAAKDDKHVKLPVKRQRPTPAAPKPKVERVPTVKVPK